MRHSMSKDTAFNGETTPRHTFLCSDSQCLPPGDPRILCAKHGYPITGKSLMGVYWTNIYFRSHCHALSLGRLTERERAGRRKPWERGWQILSLSKKTKWRTKLPEGFARPIPPFNGADFCGEGTGYSRSSGPISTPNDCLNTVFNDVFSLCGSCRNDDNALPRSPREKH